MKKVTEASKLKVGDRIRILKAPQFWSSSLNKTCPIPSVPILKFPHDLTIQELIYDSNGYDMTCGNFGWDLDCIIEAGCELVSPVSEELSELPERWYILGGPKLIEFFRGLDTGLTGNNIKSGYYKEGNFIWVTARLEQLKQYTEITLEDYLRLSNINKNSNNQKSEIMQNTQSKTDKVLVTINKNNEIETSRQGIPVSKLGILKETLITRSLKINGVERDLSVSVIVDENWNIHAGYAIRNPKWDKVNNPELARTVARNRAVNKKTNLLLNEAISSKLASKYVLKGIAEQIFANISKGIIQIKGVK